MHLFTVHGDLETELYPQPISIQQFSYSWLVLIVACRGQHASRPGICMLYLPQNLLSKLPPSRWRCVSLCSWEQGDPWSSWVAILCPPTFLLVSYLLMWVFHVWILEWLTCYLFITLTPVLCVLFFFLILPDVVPSGYYTYTYKLGGVAIAPQQVFFSKTRSSLQVTS